jgi:hypothetical protein
MRITSAGNVGIGTTSPTSRLTVNVGTGEMEGLNLRDGSNATSAFVYSSVTGENRIGGIISYAFPTFYSGGSERMRITSGGNVLIGTTTDGGAKLQVSGGDLTISNTTTTALRLNPSSSSFQASIYLSEGGSTKWEFGKSSSTPNFYFYSYGASAEVFKLNYSTGAAFFSSLGTGTVTATAGTLSTVSDSAYKIDAGFIDSALDKVMNLKPRYFYWNDKSGLPEHIKQLGFYAQEVNEALGEEAANTPVNEDIPWGISDRSMIAMLTKAIQELKAEIDLLKN